MSSGKRGWAIVFALLIAALAGLFIWQNRPETMTAAAQVRNNGEVERLAPNAAIDRPRPARRYRIGILYPFLASPFWVNEAYGVTDQARVLGVDIVWQSADGYDNIDKQNGQIEDLVSKRVDAILLAATSSTGTAPAVDRAAAAGIPVFAHVTSSSSPRVVSAVIDDDLEIGRRQAAFMGKALAGKGSVAMLNGPAAAEWSSLRVRGFKEVMKRDFPGIRIVAERFGIPDRADAQRLAEDLLSAHPKLSGLFTVADGMAMGAADAARMAGRVESMVITTASFSREAVPYMLRGDIDLNVDENPVVIGRVAMNIVVRALNGEAVPRIVYVPNPEMTRDNVGQVDPARQWAPDNWRLR